MSPYEWSGQITRWSLLSWSDINTDQDTHGNSRWNLSQYSYWNIMIWPIIWYAVGRSAEVFNLSGKNVGILRRCCCVETLGDSTRVWLVQPYGTSVECSPGTDVAHCIASAPIALLVAVHAYWSIDRLDALYLVTLMVVKWSLKSWIKQRENGDAGFRIGWV